MLDVRGTQEGTNTKHPTRRRVMALATAAALCVGIGLVAMTLHGDDAEAQQSADTPAVFVPVSPFRAYDSRTDPAGPMTSGAFRPVTMSQLPGDAVAVLVNITVVNTTTNSDGWLRVFAAGAPLPNVSTINWSANGQVLANMVTVPTGTPNHELAVNAGGNGRTDFIVDVYGYYRMI